MIFCAKNMVFENEILKGLMSSLVSARYAKHNI